MQSDKIVGKQIWLTFFHILVCIKYCSTFSKARKHFFSKQNKTLCLTRACPFHSHKIFEIFEMLFYFHKILRKPFSFQIKKTIFRLCRARASPFTPPPIQPFIQQWRRVRRSNEKQGEKKQLWFLCLSSANKGNHQNKGKNWMISLLKLWQVGSG